MYRPEDTHLTGGSCDETILDAALEELLSGEGPPDMAGRILRAHAAGRVAGDAAAIPMALPVAPPVAAPPVLPPAPPVPWVSPNGRGASRPRRSQAVAIGQRWMGIAVAASILIAGVGLGLAALFSSGWLGDRDMVARVESLPTVEPAISTMRSPTAQRPIVKHEAPLDNPFEHAPFGAEDLTASLERGVPWQMPYAVEPQAGEKIVAFVNEELARSWRAAGAQPASAIEDDEWAERVTRQLLGRAPTAGELQAYNSDSSPTKRQSLVQHLLYGDAQRGEFARHWAKTWADELLSHGAPAAQREGLQQYLAQSLAAEIPFSQITHELLTATGSNDPRAADFNGATNFVLSGIAGQREAIAGTVGRVFLGHHGQCSQCHDAKGPNTTGDELSQQQFWQIAAFFQQAKPQRDFNGATRLVDADYVGKTGDVEEAEIFFDRPDRQRKIAYPVFIDGQAISQNGRVAEVNRREELARLVVSSEAYSQAMVNTWWSHLLGRGLVSTSSQQRSGNHNAEMQQRLAEQFAAHGFHHKQLVEWIVLSEANTRAASEIDRRHVADAPLFDRFYGDDRREAPYDSFAAALDAAQRGARPLVADSGVLLARVAPARPRDDDDRSIIVRSAGSLRRLDPRDYTFVDRMLHSDMTFADKAKHLFLAGTGRAPTPAELQAAQETLARYEGHIAGALQELWWAIENSREFQPIR